MNAGAGSLVADAIEDALAGAAGTWLMDRVSTFLYEREDPAAVRQEEAARVDGADPATVAVKNIASATGTDLSTAQTERAAMVVHYALGVVPGALYGVLRQRIPGVVAGSGLLYGLGLFLVNDELLGPLLGLAAGPTAYPWQAHARGLAAHLTLGLTTEATIDVLDRAGRRRD